MIKIRVRTPKTGDQVLESTTVEEAADTLLKIRDHGIPERDIRQGFAKFGVFENSDTQLELEMATRTGLIDLLKDKANDTLRLVPVVAGG